MVLPPNRIGAIRGPGGATLDDVVAAINGLSVIVGESNVLLASQQAYLDSIANALDPALAQLLQRMTWLTGTTAPNATFGNFGLPGYLGLVLGSRAAASSELVTVWDWLRSMDDSLGRVTSAIGGNPQPIGLPDNVLLRTTLAAEALSLVTGLATDPPIGSTIKALLASIDVNQARAADCCEQNANGGGETPGAEQNPQPTDFCSGTDTATRCSGWLDVGTTVISGTTYDVRVPFFGSLPVEGYSPFAAPGTAGRRGFRHIGPDRSLMCFEWDFTGNTRQPFAFTLATAQSEQGLLDNNWYAVLPPSAGTMVRGSYSDTFDNCANGPEEGSELYIALAFPQVAGDQTIALNFFGLQDNQGCAS